LKTDRGRTVHASVGALLILAAGLGTAGCRMNMHVQNKVKPYRASVFFADGASARPLPAHTVARGDLRVDEAAYTGVRGNQPVNELPFPATRDVLLRGEERFNIFCSPCHDRTGSGHGMIVERGYKQPPAYTEDRLRNAPIGYFFSVISLGYGVMPSYSAQIPVADRWAIAAYIRVLQYSQGGVRLSDLPPAARQAIAHDLEGPGAGASPVPGGAAPQPSPTPHEVP
jgi:mono/diheme cytochrome c family protein